MREERVGQRRIREASGGRMDTVRRGDLRRGQTMVQSHLGSPGPTAESAMFGENHFEDDSCCIPVSLFYFSGQGDQSRVIRGTIVRFCFYVDGYLLFIDSLGLETCRVG